MEPHIVTIFGASGDLTRRKLIPALYKLFLQDLLPERFAVVGVGRKPFTDEIFREQMSAALKAYSGNPPGDSPEKADAFVRLLFYTSLDTSNPASYSILKKELEKLGEGMGSGSNLIFYLLPFFYS